MSTTDRTIDVRDGRTLGFAQFGAPDGPPVFEFHGNPSSRLGARLLDGTARDLGITVIGIDRPGMGLSSYAPGRTLLDWPRDVIEVADHLGLPRFSVLGGSGGVPSTLACAHQIPDRLDGVGVLFGPRPLGERGATRGWTGSLRIRAMLGRHGPLWLGEAAMKAAARALERDADAALQRLFRDLPAVDRAVLGVAGVGDDYLAAIREAFRSGARGVALDYRLSMRDWGFDLEEIRTPVHLWHGEKDTVTPSAMGKYLADAIPNCVAHILPDEGHFSLLPNHAAEILAALTPSRNGRDSP